MNRRHLIILMGIGALLLFGGTAYLLLPPHRGAEPPQATATIPDLPLNTLPSLASLADRFPHLADILRDPELATVYKEFLVAYEQGGEEAALALARTRGLLTPDGKGLRVTLVLDTHESDPLIRQLETIGVETVSVYEDRINITIPLDLIRQLVESETPDLIFEQLTELQHVIAVRLPEGGAPKQQSVIGEGVELIGADVWHDQGYTGEGVRIGILDGGFAGYEELLGTELPDEVELQRFGWVDADESHGVACAEIIHEVAPDARLFFAWYDFTYAAMGEALEWFAEQDVDIISHSGGFFIGPRDGSGWASELVDEQADQGRIWVNAAGNEAERHYRSLFTDGDGDGFHDFEPGHPLLAVYSTDALLVVLQWEDDWEAPTQDYDLYVLDAEGNVLGSSEDVQNGEAGQQPAESVKVETGGDTVYIAIQAFDTTRNAILDLFTYGDGVMVETPTPAYSLDPPGDARGALAVGAINWWDQTLAFYSSQGPAYDGRLKPELTAPSGVSGVTYGEEAFDGTSASAPHVAGALALVWSARPDLSRRQVIDVLLRTARDAGPVGPDPAYGYGSLVLPPPETLPSIVEGITGTPTPVSYVTLAPSEQSVNAPTSRRRMSYVGFLAGGMGCLGGVIFLLSAVMLLRSGGRPAPPPPVPHRVEPPPVPTPLTPMSPSPPEPAPPSPCPAPRRCPACGAEVRPEARFCPRCRTPLTPSAAPTESPPQSRTCPYCGATLRPQARFCPRCGRPL